MVEWIVMPTTHYLHIEHNPHEKTNPSIKRIQRVIDLSNSLEHIILFDDITLPGSLGPPPLEWHPSGGWGPPQLVHTMTAALDVSIVVISPACMARSVSRNVLRDMINVTLLLQSSQYGGYWWPGAYLGDSRRHSRQWTWTWLYM